MSRLQAYLDLYEKMETLATYAKLKEDVLMRGNLAYFVDKFYETVHWDQMMETISAFINRKDVNELCWYITQRIFELYIRDKKARASEAEVRLMEDIHALRQVAYQEREYNDLDVVDKDAFPEFFIAHERMTYLLDQYGCQGKAQAVNKAGNLSQ